MRYAQPRPSLDAPAAAASAVSPRPNPERAAAAAPLARGQPVQWPIARKQLTRVGESVLADRNGRGDRTRGIDLFADAGTEVMAACAAGRCSASSWTAQPTRARACGPVYRCPRAQRAGVPLLHLG